MQEYNDRFKEALNNNLNTSMCLTILYDLLKDNTVNDSTKIELINKFDTVLSLDLLKVDINKELEEKVNSLINLRNNYKKEKNYLKADEIREEIESLGVKIKDTREGTQIIWN